ncbi:MAG: ABC transporter permease [Vicinamibacteria bacterium]|nr:ABC transporter permease [Vicinamibacteria bacterium]
MGLFGDLMLGLRRARRDPGFSAVVVATLALGIGATTAIYSVVHAVLLRPLPFDRAEQLLALTHVTEGQNAVMSPPNFLDLSAALEPLVASTAAYTDGNMTLTGRGDAVHVTAVSVSASFFDVLRQRPALGRGFATEENEPGRERVVVLTDGLWRSRFGADPAIVGQVAMLDEVAHEVIGVLPPGPTLPEDAEAFVPLAYDEGFRQTQRGAWYLDAIGRLRDGATLEQASALARTTGERLAKQHPRNNEGVGMDVLSLHERTVRRARPALLLLMGAVGAVLLIACANLVNLQLARAVSRGAELAVRGALGAGRGRLVRQMVAEAAVLGGLGSALGLLLAAQLLPALLALQPADLPRAGEVRLDPFVLGAGLGLGLLCSVIVGLVPALRATSADLSPALREGGRGLLGGQGGRLRRGLVVAETALAVVLVASAGLLVRSFSNLRAVDPGFRSESALAVRIELPPAYGEGDKSRRVAFYRDLQARLDALPGSLGSAASIAMPLTGFRWNFSFTVEGRPEANPAQQPSLETRIVTASYFRTLGIPLVRGRLFRDDDTRESTPVVVISDSAARRHFPGEDPIGKRIRLGLGFGDGRRAGGEVVGIVADVKLKKLDEDEDPEIYLPHSQAPLGSMEVVVRAAVPPETLAAGVRAAVKALDPALAVGRPRTLDEVVGRSISGQRFTMLLVLLFAQLALALAALGLFGVLAHHVAQRTREIGVRLALGAEPGAVRRLVMGEALALAAAGVGLGLLGTAALSRVLRAQLFALSPTDPASLGLAALSLLAAAAVAAALPALRASRVDPVIALRAE